MPLEQLQAQQYETAEMIAYNLDKARKEVVAMTGDPAFHDSYAVEYPGADIYDDMGKPRFWESFANYANETIEKEAPNPEDMTLDLRAKQLLAETPRYLFAQTELEAMQTKLNTLGHTLGYRESAQLQQRKNYTRQLTSRYNNLLRSFAYDYPETSVADVRRNLETMANIAMEDHVVEAGRFKPNPAKQNASKTIDSAIRGAQHELAYEPVLQRTGREYSAASREQDLEGSDWLVLIARDPATGRERWLSMDAKASDYALKESGRMDLVLPFSIVGYDKILVHLPLEDRHFHGKFFPSGEATATMARGLNAIIDKATQVAA